MELNEYQERAMATCMESSRNHSYMMDNLIAEVGEYAGKVAKAKRKELLEYDEEGIIVWLGECDAMEAFEAELKKEAGDILWQLSGLCTVMDWSLEEVAKGNLRKLASRQDRGVIDGNGDNR